MILQERDRKILQLCYEQGFLTVEHLHRGFFSKAGMGAAYRRVRELEAGGFLRRSKVSVLSGQSMILPTVSGVGIARAISEFEVPVRKRPLLHTLDHDALVTSVRLRLCELYVDSSPVWTPEGHLKRQGGELIPDGLLRLTRGRTMVVEVENSQKSKKRIVSILDHHVKNHSDKLVVYVAANRTIEACLQNNIQTHWKPGIFAVISWESLQSEDPVLWTTAAQIKLFNNRNNGGNA
jgi:hypothetical protein